MIQKKSKKPEFSKIFDKVGSFGRFQYLVYGLICLVCSAPGIHNNLSVFTQFTQTKITCNEHNLDQNVYSIDTRCPEKGQTLDYCHYQAANSSDSTPATCNEFLYGETANIGSSIIDDFNLICDKSTVPSLLTSVYFIGFTLGAQAGAIISDNIGRKYGVSIGLIVATASGCLPYFYDSSLYVYAICRFLSAVGLNAAYVSAFTLATEVIGPKHLTIPAIWIQGAFAAGACLLSIYAHFIIGWQNLQLWSSLYCLPIMFLFEIFVPESVRFLTNKNQPIRALKVLKKMDQMNHGKQNADLNLAQDATICQIIGLPNSETSRDTINSTSTDKTSSLEGLDKKFPIESDYMIPEKVEQFMEVGPDGTVTSSGSAADEKFTAMDLFRDKNMGFVTLNVMYNWFTCSTVFYTLNLNAASLPLSLDRQMLCFVLGDLFENHLKKNDPEQNFFSYRT